MYSVDHAGRRSGVGRKGWATGGRVTGCTPNRSLFDVYYEFSDESGALIEGSSISGEALDYNSGVIIIYLRNNPKRNGLYPLTSYQIDYHI
jgi:hypothetical protein